MSPAFSVGGFEFSLSLRCQQDGDRDYTGLFLHMTKGWKAPVKWEFEIMNANNTCVSESFSGEHTYLHLEARGNRAMLTNEVMRAYLNSGKVTVRAIVSVKTPSDLASAQLLTW
jgi:hypothetical protein